MSYLNYTLTIPDPVAAANHLAAQLNEPDEPATTFTSLTQAVAYLQGALDDYGITRLEATPDAGLTVTAVDERFGYDRAVEFITHLAPCLTEADSITITDTYGVTIFNVTDGHGYECNVELTPIHPRRLT